MLYDGREVEGLRLVEVMITNTGGQAITPDDFHEPLTITFPDYVEVYEAEVTHTKPEDFRPEVELKGKAVEVKPTLMNPGDTMVVKALATIPEEVKPDISGRITGIARIIKSPVTSPSQALDLTKYFLAATLPLLVGAFLGGLVLVWLTRLVGIPLTVSPIVGASSTAGLLLLALLCIYYALKLAIERLMRIEKMTSLTTSSKLHTVVVCMLRPAHLGRALIG